MEFAVQMTCSACEREIKATLAGVNGNHKFAALLIVILVAYAAV